MLTQDTEPSFRGKITISQENHLCNVGPQSTNKLAHENNLKICLDLYEPALGGVVSVGGIG